MHSVPSECIAANIAHSRSLGLPTLACQAGGGALNVVGRGPSVARCADELRSGVNWACGTAWGWCRDNGIDATFVCADANPRLAEPKYTAGVKRAILAEQCDPALFAALSGAELYRYDTGKGSGNTTAAMAICMAPDAGYPEVRLYGCDSSYGETTHVNEQIDQPNLMQVRCGYEVFKTNPQMIMQAEELSGAVRALPAFLKNRSGGFLSALIAHNDWQLVEWKNAPDKVREMMN